MIVPASPDLPIVWHAAIIRFDSIQRGPYLHHNSAHYAVGIDIPPSCDFEVLSSGRIRVVFADDGEARPVLFGFCAADETMVGKDVTAGYSGGVAEAHIQMAVGGVAVPASDARLYATNANLWCGWAKAA